jgi:phospholipase/carboxylesterase
MSCETYVHRFVPGADASDQTLVLLHGTGGDEESFLDLGRALMRPGEPAMAMLSIRGNVSEGGMNRFFRRLAEGVYDMEDLARRTGELDAFLASAAAQYDRPQAGFIGVGYSNGANILANLLFTRPSAVGAAVLMHPLIPFTPQPQPGLAGKPVFVSAGEEDPITTFEETQKLMEWLGRQGMQIAAAVHRGGHEVRPEEVEAIRNWLAGLRRIGT